MMRYLFVLSLLLFCLPIAAQEAERDWTFMTDFGNVPLYLDTNSVDLNKEAQTVSIVVRLGEDEQSPLYLYEYFCSGDYGYNHTNLQTNKKGYTGKGNCLAICEDFGLGCN